MDSISVIPICKDVAFQTLAEVYQNTIDGHKFVNHK